MASLLKKLATSKAKPFSLLELLVELALLLESRQLKMELMLQLQLRLLPHTQSSEVQSTRQHKKSRKQEAKLSLSSVILGMKSN